MPHYVLQDKNKSPILVYEAPVDEKTMKIREMFDVDPETGYPRKYNWRSMARLGSDYRPEDPFLKFQPWDPKREYGDHVGIIGSITAAFGVSHYLFNRFYRRWWSKPQYTLAAYAFTVWSYLLIKDKTLERQAKKDAIYVDYMRKHPERFETIHRPKLREVLFDYTPLR